MQAGTARLLFSNGDPNLGEEQTRWVRTAFADILESAGPVHVSEALAGLALFGNVDGSEDMTAATWRGDGPLSRSDFELLREVAREIGAVAAHATPEFGGGWGLVAVTTRFCRDLEVMDYPNNETSPEATLFFARECLGLGNALGAVQFAWRALTSDTAMSPSGVLEALDLLSQVALPVDPAREREFELMVRSTGYSETEYQDFIAGPAAQVRTFAGQLHESTLEWARTSLGMQGAPEFYVVGALQSLQEAPPASAHGHDSAFWWGGDVQSARKEILTLPPKLDPNTPTRSAAVAAGPSAAAGAPPTTRSSQGPTPGERCL